MPFSIASVTSCKTSAVQRGCRVSGRAIGNSIVEVFGSETMVRDAACPNAVRRFTLRSGYSLSVQRAAVSRRVQRATLSFPLAGYFSLLRLANVTRQLLAR